MEHEQTPVQKMLKHEMIQERGMGYAIAQMILSIDAYCMRYKRRFESSVGDDYVLVEGVKEALRGVRALLNGPLGAEDGGTLDKAIMTIARDNDITLEE